jgi:hypothetical protein
MDKERLMDGGAEGSEELWSQDCEDIDTAGVRPVALRLYNHLMLDIWPTQAGIDDFGIDSAEHYGALQYAVKYDGVTPKQLDAACGKGRAIQALIGPENPYGSVVFKTFWDDLLSLSETDEPDEPGEG